MSENLIFVINGVVPLFVVVWVGSFLKYKKAFSPQTISELNKLCFNVLLPCSLFSTIISTDIRTKVDMKLIGYLGFSFAASAFILSLLIPRFIKSRPQAGAVIHGSFRSNVVLLGIPLAQNLLSHEGAALMAVAISVLVPIFNVIGIIVLTWFSDDKTRKPSPISVLKNIVKNPLLIAAASGFVVSLLGIEFPTLVTKPIKDLASAATPIAMLVLGAQFSFQSATSHMRVNLTAAFLKLVFLPTVCTTIGYLIGLRDIQLGVVFLSHAAPAAASSAMLADSMGCDGIIAGEIVLVTSCLSVVTIFCGTLLLKTLGVF